MKGKRRKGINPVVDTKAKKPQIHALFPRGPSYYIYAKHRNVENVFNNMKYSLSQTQNNTVNILTLPFWIEKGNLNLTKEDLLYLGLRKFQERKTRR